MAWLLAGLLLLLLKEDTRAQTPLTAVIQAGTITCIGDSTEIILLPGGGTPPYHFSRDGVHFQSSPAFQGLQAGQYLNFMVMDSVGITFHLPAFTLDDGSILPDEYYLDFDGDGYGTGNAVPLCHDPGSGYSLVGGDCDDTSGMVNPGLQEVCNAIDDDCDGLADDSLIFQVYYVDLDGDHFGNGPGIFFCMDPGHDYATNNEDCNDSNPLINPAVQEEFNGIDDNCNGLIDFDDPYFPEPCDLTLSAQGAITCYGGTADIVLTITGGTAPYTHGPGSTSGLLPGTYTYTVMDATGCTSSVTHVLSNPNLLEIQVSSSGINCYGEQAIVAVSATGGTGAISGTGLFQRGAGMWTFLVSDSAGCTSQTQIDLQQPSPLQLQVNAGTIQCHGGTAQVVVSASGGVLPYNGIGTYFQSAGSQTYVLIDANGCTRDTTISLIQPDSLPTPTVWTGQLTACVPAINGSAVFSVDPVSDGVNPTMYSWTPPAGMTIISGQGNPQVVLGWTGANVDKSIHGPITLSISNGCITHTAVRTVSYSTAAPITPPSISGPSKLCPGDTAIYSFSAVARATRYVWMFPAGLKFVGDSTSNVVTMIVQSNYTGGTINVTAWNACGGSPARSRSLLLNIPLAPGTISGMTSGLCGMTSITYSIASVTGATGYQWSVPPGAVIHNGQGTTQISVDFTAGGSGSVKVKSYNSCGVSAERSISVSLVPFRPDLITSNPTGPPCAGTLVGYSVPTVTSAQAYLWSTTSGGLIQGGQGTKSIAIAWNSASAGTSQSISVRASNGCGNSTTRAMSMTVGSCLKIEADLEEGSIRSKVYPNPAHGTAFVSYAMNDPGPVYFKVYSITGHLLHDMRVMHEREGDFVHELPIQALGLSGGVYVIAITRGGITENSRLVVR